jgi:hypothetical protein
LVNGATTGALTQHALRLNSTSKCSVISNEIFPVVCPGPRPFSANYSPPGLSINVCVPGNYTENPFPPHRNRQDIKEELFLDVIAHPYTYSDKIQSNFTLSCEVNTSRGYFELGNYQNGYKAGPLLDKWPSLDNLANAATDNNGMIGIKARPSEW